MASWNLLGMKAISAEAWGAIIVASIWFSCGCLVAGRVSLKRLSGLNQNRILLIAHGFTAIAVITVSVNGYLALRYYGNLAEFLASANEIYANRVMGDKAPSVPYLTYLALFSASVYSISIRESGVTLIKVLPLFILAIDAIINLGRSTVLATFLIYLAPFAISFFSYSFLKKLSVVGAIVILSGGFLVATNALRDARGGFEDYQLPESPTIEYLTELGIFRPSLYLYLTAPIVVLSETIVNEKKTPFGQVFNPIVRLFYRPFGIEMGNYEANYSIGFRESNTGTYLKDIYEDFGPTGLAVFPLLLGWIFTRLSMYSRQKAGITSSAILYNFVFAMIVFSPILNLIRTGPFLFALMVSIIILRFRIVRA